MNRKNIEEFSTEVLTKRKKIALFILGILICVSIIGIVTAILTDEYKTLVPVMGMIAVWIPMENGLKKINMELIKRSTRKKK